MYRQTHTDFDDHLKWWSSVIGSYLHWYAENFKDVGKWSFLNPCVSVGGIPVSRALGLYLYSLDGVKRAFESCSAWIYYTEYKFKIHCNAVLVNMQLFSSYGSNAVLRT